VKKKNSKNHFTAKRLGDLFQLQNFIARSHPYHDKLVFTLVFLRFSVVFLRQNLGSHQVILAYDFSVRNCPHFTAGFRRLALHERSRSCQSANSAAQIRSAQAATTVTDPVLSVQELWIDSPVELHERPGGRRDRFVVPGFELRQVAEEVLGHGEGAADADLADRIQPG